MNPGDYAKIWTQDEDLESLNRRIHDGVPVSQLPARARGYCDTMFNTLYPQARPTSQNRVMEFGSGVGWIMEAMLGEFSPKQIVGLDISANMIRRAQERFTDQRVEFVLYEGFQFPFPNGHFHVVYSVATLQHIEKHIAFLLLRELYRVLAVGGHAVLHFLSVYIIPNSPAPYDTECWNHINGAQTHWHHYYSFDELFVIFSQLIGVDDLDIRYLNESFWVHFSIGTGRRVLRPEVLSLTYPDREKQLRSGWIKFR
jgi:ubiquinone/menaquinone biosynthesis C-methylase UbiE